MVGDRSCNFSRREKLHDLWVMDSLERGGFCSLIGRLLLPPLLGALTLSGNPNSARIRFIRGVGGVTPTSNGAIKLFKLRIAPKFTTINNLYNFEP